MAQQRVMAHGAERGHIEHGADVGAAAPDHAPALELAALMGMRRHSHQRRDLAAAEPSQFGQFGN